MSAWGQLQKQLGGGPPEGLYVLLGDDDFAREAALRLLEETTGGGPPLERTLVRADEAGADAVAVAVGSSSLFGDRRLVVVRGFDRLSAAEQDRLVPRLAEPAPGTAVAVVAAALDGRRNATKALRKAGHTFTFATPRGEALAGWVRQHARELGFDMTPAAVAALLDTAPPEPQMLHTELEKLALYADGGAVGPEAVREVASLAVPFAAERLIFRLTEYIVAGQTAAALDALRDLLSVGEAPLVILTMIGRQYRILAVAAGDDVGAARRHLQRLFRLPSFVVNRTLSQARALGVAAVERGLRRIVAADEAMKKSQDPRLPLEALVVALAQNV